MQYFFLTIIKSIYATVENFKNTHKKEQEKEILHALEPVHILIHVDPVFIAPAYVTCA